MRDAKISKAAIAQELHIPLEDLNDSVFGLVMTPLQGGGAGRPTPEREKSSHLRAV